MKVCRLLVKESEKPSICLLSMVDPKTFFDASKNEGWMKDRK